MLCLALAAGMMMAGTVRGATPSVVVSNATGIGVGAATLNGTLTSDGGAATTVYFCWGTNDFQTTSTSAWPNVVSYGTATSGQSVSNDISGLIYGIRYWYRAYATNAAGDSWSAPTNFVTTAPTSDSCLPGLSVRAWKATGGALDVDSARYDLTNPSPAPNDTTTGGTIGYATESIDMTGDDSEHFGAGRNSGVPDSSTRPTDYKDQYCVEYRGKLLASGGTYRFATTSDDGSALWIDPATDNPSYSTAIVQNNASQPMTTKYSSQVALSAGYHDIIVRHNEGSGGNGLKVQWDPAGGTTWAAIPGANFFHVAAGSGAMLGITITNTTATAVGTTQATLNGVLTGSNVYFDVYAYWGPANGTNNPAVWTNSAYVGGYTLSGATTSSNIAHLATSGIAADGAYWYTLCASNAATNLWATPSKTFITGEVTVRATDNQAIFPNDTGAFAIERPAACTNVPLTVSFAMGGSATSGVHYTLQPASAATLDAGATSTVVTLTPTYAGVGEAVLTLTAASYRVGAMNSATVTITTYVGPPYTGFVCVVPPGHPGHVAAAPPYNTWTIAFTNLQAALDYAVTKTNATVYLAGQTFSTPTSGAEASSLYVWQNATNVALRGGYRADPALDAPAPGLRDATAYPTVLRRLAASGDRRVLRMSSVSNAVIEQVTIRDGQNVSAGVGVYLINCWDVTLANCIITNNISSSIAGAGGGLYLDGSGVTLTNTTVVNNRHTGVYGAISAGGGMYVNGSSRLTLTRSVLRGNAMVNSDGNWCAGGGFAVAGGGVIELYETVVLENDSSASGNPVAGGAGYNAGTLRMRNCLMIRNKAKSNPNDGLYLAGGAATFVNCTIVSNNTVGVLYVGGTVAMTNCIVRGHSSADMVSVPLANVWYSNIGDGQNNGAQGCTSLDPLFVDTTYYHLKSSISNYTGGYFSGGTWASSTVDSPAIDAGDPASPYSREPAPNGGRINMGYDGNTEVASVTYVPPDRAPAVTNPGATEVGHRSALLNGQVTDTGYPKALACFRYWAVGSAITSETARAEQLSAFNATVTNLTPGAAYQYLVVASNRVQEALSTVASFSTHPTPSYLYVATSGNDTAGTNWVTAYTAVQTALDRAETGDTIYLAGHTFSGGISGTLPGHPNNCFLKWQNATNIALRGGYDAQAGTGGSNPGTRTGMTTLQRTVGGVRVLTMIGVTNCTLEQVTIRDGLATEGGGYGVYLTSCWDVTFASCVVSNNNGAYYYGGYGLGMFLNRSSVVLTNTTIVNNTGLGQAWGMYGGGIYIDSLSRMTAIRSSVKGNGFPQSTGNGSVGGGILVDGVLNLYESVVSGNMAGDATFGGGIYNSGLLAMRNCLVYSNSCLRPADSADGLHLSGGAATLVNCTIAYNRANDLGGVGIRYVGGTVSMTNCIVWGHSTADLSGFGAGQLANVGYSAFAVPGTQHGVNGCITNDPLFAGAATNDYRLRIKPVPSRAINAGFSVLTGWMLSDTDLAGVRRRQAGAIDMGAYETMAPGGTVLTLR